jgi:DNA-directed RNA polymerase specialized sigma24 family protein
MSSPRQLDEAYDTYRQDPNTASDFFKLCLAVAHQQTSISAWNESKLNREDIAQEAAIAAFVALPTLKEGTIFALWYLGVIRNKTNDALRKLYTTTAKEKAYPTTEDGREDLMAGLPNYESRQDSQWTRIAEAAGDNLPLVRLIGQGLTVEEAANEIGITKKAAQNRISRIRKKQANNA